MEKTIEWYQRRNRARVVRLSEILSALKRKFHLTQTQAEDVIEKYAEKVEA
jgi:hypothetical protein